MLQAVLTESVKRILDQFRECFGIRIVFYDANKQLLKSGLDQPDCSYCQAIQKLYGPERCMADNECGRSRAVDTGALTIYQCHAGFIEAILPIYEHGCLLGFAMIGQIRTKRQVPIAILRDWKKQYNNDALRKAFFAKDFVSAKRLDSILSLFSICVEHVIKNHLVKLRIDSNLVHVLEYMRQHVYESYTLQDVATHFNRSSYALSHAFSRQLGQSFKQVYIEMKLNAAEELMRDKPELTVTEVADQMGYDDPFYFSRLFSKHRHIPPSKFLEKLRS